MNTTSDLGRLRSVHARVLMVTLALAVSVIGLPDQAIGDPADDASVAVALLNETRWAAGLGGLAPDRELQVIANRQANRMAEAGALFHSEDLGGELSWGWWAWSENVGRGWSVGGLHNAFMISSDHSSNILNSFYNYVGVGVAYASDGRVYVAQVFGAW